MILNSKLNLFGGEPELLDLSMYFGVTNSGRSSLRLAILSMDLSKKKVLVPDFVCQIVIDVLLESQIEIIFYKVSIDFSFDVNEVVNSGCDAIYLVKYFGVESESFKSVVNSSSSISLIIDDVFGLGLSGYKTEKHWLAFNSLRKISFVAGYSNVVSNKPILTDKIFDELLGFECAKYRAKNIKAKYILGEKVEEESYLNEFLIGERILDESKGIYQPTAKSVYYANLFYSNLFVEEKERFNNLNTARDSLPSYLYLDINPSFPSFLPLKIGKKRNKLRNYLMSKNCFLAVHWPKNTLSNNEISDCLLSLPLDSRYTENEIEKVCLYILEYLE